MNVLGWIIIGLLAGWIASALVTAPRSGCLWNLVIGILGAAVGGAVYKMLSDDKWDWEFDLGSLVVATLGSVALLLVINAITGRSRRR